MKILFWIILYLAAVSLTAIYLTISDKKKAKNNVWRVKESTLLLIAALGGSAAMYITMKKIRHKTKHKKFMIGIPLIMAAQVIVIALLVWFFIF